MAKNSRIGILIFEDVEVLDVAGPFEVFSLSGFEVITVAESSPVKMRNGLSVNPDYLLAEAPPLDILLVPGGPGARREIHNENLLHWIRERSHHVKLLLSVCTGALLLAKAGLVHDMELTTHHHALEELHAIAPMNKITPNVRWVDNDKVILSGGVASGIDMSFYVVANLLGEEAARKTADYMEYPYPL